jgi:hypothetical protein
MLLPDATCQTTDESKKADEGGSKSGWQEAKPMGKPWIENGNIEPPSTMLTIIPLARSFFEKFVLSNSIALTVILSAFGNLIG